MLSDFVMASSVQSRRDCEISDGVMAQLKTARER